MLLEAALVELRVIERGEVRRQSPEHPDQSELPGDAVAGETKSHFPREFEPMLGLSLDVTERISGRDTVCDRVDAAIGRIRKVTGILRHLEGAPEEGARRPQGLSPVGDMDGEDQVDTSPETAEPMLLDQIQGEPAEAEPCLVFSEVRPQDAAQPCIGEA